VAVEASVPTTVFVETAGMSLTPPNSCDDIQAERALDEVYDEDGTAVRPACESACRVDTCASLLVTVDLRIATWDVTLASVRSELAQVCEASVDGCVGVAGVVMRGEELDTIGLVAAVAEPDAVEGDEARRSPDEYARLRDACEAEDAAACFALVDIPQLYYQTEWDQVRYQSSMAAFERACALEPRVYCRPLQTMIDDTTHECGG
jgi:hypothetical protein